MAPTQTAQPSMADLVGELSSLLQPAQDQFKKDIVEAQSIKSIDPAVLQQAIGAGGALSTAEDFGTSSAWAMTPDLFKQTLQQRPDAMQQAANATTLSDAIFGRSAERKAYEEAARSGMENTRTAIPQAVRMAEGFADRTQRSQEAEANRQNQMAIQRLQESGANARNAAQIKLQREKMDREMMILKDAVAAGNARQEDLINTGRLFFNPDLEKNSAEMYDKLQNDKKAPEWKKDYEYLKKLAYGGAQRGAIVPLSVTHSVPTNQGDRTFDYAILGTKGWVYGNLDAENKFIPDTSGIAVPLTSVTYSPKGSGSGRSGGTTSTLVNKYAK
jgi:hypothetical protein